MSTLLVTTGHHVGRRFTLGKMTRLGRAPDNEIVLPDNLVSRYHAQIERVGPTFLVSDLGSKNGILINDRRLMDHSLRRGDQLKIGATTLVFEAPQELKTARFTNTLIHLDSDQDETMRVMDKPSLPDSDAGGASSLVLKLAQVFETTSNDLPEVLRQILGHLLELFGATAGSILLRGRGGEIAPLTAVAQGEELHINRDAIRMVLDEGKAVLTASFFAQAEGKPGRRARKAMIAPMFDRENPFGALHLERPDGADYALKDIMFLQALARLVSGAIRQAIRIDQLGQDRAGTTYNILGRSAAMDHIRSQLERIATTDSTVLITGETGTGKELLARAIHDRSPRASEPFIAINCAAIPAALIESELFGHERGAFTGADAMKRGKIELADGGTLFLDEIGEMDVALQPKLLRFLEERIFYRVGGVRPIQTDVRILTATNRDLDEAVRLGRFRQDLFFRLNVLSVSMPPLRSRREDIHALVEHFVPQIAARLGKPYLGVDDQAWRVLETYRWPGNVRELLQSVERALILSDSGLLRPEHFQIQPATSEPDTTSGEETGTQPSVDSVEIEGITHPDVKGVPPTLAEVEKRAIIQALRHADGNKNRAADILSIHRNTLRKKMQEYGIKI